MDYNVEKVLYTDIMGRIVDKISSKPSQYNGIIWNAIVLPYERFKSLVEGFDEEKEVEGFDTTNLETKAILYGIYNTIQTIMADLQSPEEKVTIPVNVAGTVTELELNENNIPMISAEIAESMAETTVALMEGIKGNAQLISGVVDSILESENSRLETENEIKEDSLKTIDDGDDDTENTDDESGDESGDFGVEDDSEDSEDNSDDENKDDSEGDENADDSEEKDDSKDEKDEEKTDEEDDAETSKDVDRDDDEGNPFKEDSAKDASKESAYYKLSHEGVLAYTATETDEVKTIENPFTVIFDSIREASKSATFIEDLKAKCNTNDELVDALRKLSKEMIISIVSCVSTANYLHISLSSDAIVNLQKNLTEEDNTIPEEDTL